jgi:outer membrane protein assembly factor BamE
LGSPMIKDPFHSNRWDYLNLITVGDEKIVEKKLVVIFDDENLLSSWEIVSD